MEQAYKKFMRYAAIQTASKDGSQTHPTTKCQFELANLLVQELKALDVCEVSVDENCYVYGKIPATKGYEESTKLGFIAHMDTVSDFAEHAVKVLIHENYNGEDLKLGESGRTLEKKTFPHLEELKGRTLITSDGTTILGADDKAGISEIMCMVERLKEEKIPHGPISIGFTPDEEVGQGADLFDVQKFGAEFAYTVDGGSEDEIEYENFNAASAEIITHGFNVHPGNSKNVMVNAALVAMEINEMIPKNQTPRDTEGYEGFYHLCEMEGSVEKARLSYIIRDHDTAKFQQKQKILKEICEKINEKYGEKTAEIVIKEQYLNMAEIIKKNFHLIENAKKAMENAQIVPKVIPVRGGTDGARLSFMGLPCPNLGTGSFACHGPYEHATVEGMDKVVQVLIEIVKLYC